MTHKQMRTALMGYSDSKGKFQRIRDTLAFQEAIAWKCKGLQKLKGYIKLTAQIFLKSDNNRLPERRGDLANYIKAIEDGLQYGGIIAPKGNNKRGNDKMIIAYGSGTGIYPAEVDGVVITLEEI